MIKDLKLQFVLASSSPRRKELLKQIGIEPIIAVSSYQEISSGDSIFTVVESNAKGKLCDVIAKDTFHDCVVIAADTVVVVDNNVFGKPKDKEDAAKMLTGLSGKVHQVITGVAIYYHNKIMYDYRITNVHMKNIQPKAIMCYISSGEPSDKAGGYGIQGLGAVFVEKIDGCYSNVVGLPLPLLYDMLCKFNLNIL